MTIIEPQPEPSPQLQPELQPAQSSNIPDTPTHDTPSQPITPPQQEQRSQQAEAARQSEVDVWPLKELEWPPDDETRPKIRIITQNENGPCGLIALCNILILRGDIVIQPPGRKSVSYEYLAGIIADHILASPLLDPTSDDLTKALSTLPHTQRGMDLNPVFTELSAFSASPSSTTHAPTLFNLSRVRLVHGWLADPQSPAYAALEKVKDYDAATNLIVSCDSLMGGRMVESIGEGGNGDVPKSDTDGTTSDEHRRMIEEAFLVRDFLESNPTQLTYHGLESLFTAMHARELVCLFRNSHLGVLYKRVDENGHESLWTLVTDANFANEGAIAWESLCDIDGAGSVFVDSRFRPANTAGGDYAGHTADQILREQAQVEALANEASDFEIAQQLQAEEEEQERRRVAAEERRRREQQQSGRQPVYAPQHQQPPTGQMAAKLDCDLPQTSRLLKPQVEMFTLRQAVAYVPSLVPRRGRMFALYSPRYSERTPTFANQRGLPRLPVPKLRPTLDRYLKSLEPLIAESGQNAELEMQKRVRMAEEFEQGIGKLAQARLIDLDNASENNWLNDNFWMKKAYHEWRAPLLINSNWWLLLQHDSTIPDHIKSHDGTCSLTQGVKLPTGGEISDWQIRRAAWLVSRLMNFKERLDAQDIYPDSSRTGPLCMHQYTRLFNLTRIPKPECDMINAQPPEKNGRHIHIMLNDWCYTVQVYDGAGRNIGAKEIENRLWDVVKDVQKREAEGQRAKRVSILTSDDRTQWANNREYLLTLSDQNRSSFDAIETAMLTISLDPYTLAPSTNSNQGSDQFKQPVLDAHVRNISSGINGLNRWFDKSLTVSVESNGRTGMNGEHSPCDALIPSIIADYVIAEPINIAAFSETTQKLGGMEYVGLGEGQGWKHLDWEVDSKIEAEIKQAEARAKTIVEDSDASQLWYSEYATDWMKKSAKVPPDAYIQLALQLAWYRQQGSFTATYETASTRLFKHGRTDVIRTYSTDTRDFVKQMTDPGASTDTKIAALQRAITSHNTYTRDASTGKGCDRHLFGLQQMLRSGESTPLFEDELFAKSAEWKLSTSGLSAGERFLGTGFGTIWPDGYGINYLAGPKLIKFGIESKHSCPTTSTADFKSKIVESLREMKALFKWLETVEGAGKVKL
ncbi:choline/carnitine O-acyltransferase [Rhizoctonia solani AG-3 Rhs1AP]|uniref:Choline/carnitine O-acyltransferase n=2 Tax=Rhizoctonia solani AG-3 TaxID=1086053 RepID=A0A074S825_9AGAM|nr:choline/carnitine O-acyltransferase [Rhizoctonia solani AG-3 Rhs1AP]KEP53078.1 choline/carnitine O-acyltransferase [Rhizoctonia solani 123E]